MWWIIGGLAVWLVVNWALSAAHNPEDEARAYIYYHYGR